MYLRSTCVCDRVDDVAKAVLPTKDVLLKALESLVYIV